MTHEDQGPGTDAARSITLARQEVNAALSVLLDPASDPASAEVHILDAWVVLYESSKSGAIADAPPELADWIRSSAVPLPERDRSRAASLASDLSSRQAIPLLKREAGPGHRELLKHTRLLQGVIDAMEPGRRGASAMRKVRLWRAAYLAAGLIVMVAFLLVTRNKESLGTGAWRGDYYPTHTFEGTPILKRDDDIQFNWGSKPPLERISADKFSIRWDTCLVVSESTTFGFMLTTDDGSKLFVDGEPVIDLWKSRGSKTGNANTTLEAGVHHVRLDYFEARGSAKAILRASIDGAKPEPIPNALLVYPGDQLDANDPCKHISREQSN